MTNPNQRYSVGLVPTLGAVPAPPPATAGPAAVPEAGAVAGRAFEALPAVCNHGKLAQSCETCAMAAERDAARAELRAEVEQHIAHIDALRVARAEAEDLIIALQAKTQDAMVDEARAESPEAIGVRALAADWRRLAAERDALRGALAGLAAAADDGEWHDSEDCEVEGRTDCRLCAALATATAIATAPQAAGTGGADQTADWRDCDCGICAQCNGQEIRQASTWTREAPTEAGEYWAIVDRWSDPEPQMVSLKVAESGDTWWASDSYDDTYGYAPRQILLWGPIAVTSIPPGWREALAALDQDQEADHAAH